MRVFSTLLAAAVVAISAAPAKADYFVWQDAKTGVSLSYPDTWRMINNQQPDDLVTIIGPSQDDTPTCRLRAREDNRYTVYPVWYSAAVQRVAYDENFWDDYMGGYNNIKVHSYKDDAGLGKAFASMVMTSFSMPNDTENHMRIGQMWAGVYHDTAYVLDCSSAHTAFKKWQPDFVSIAKSVDMRKVMHELVTGDYPRNFIKDDGYLTHPVTNGADHMGQTYN